MNLTIYSYETVFGSFREPPNVTDPGGPANPPPPHSHNSQNQILPDFVCLPDTPFPASSQKNHLLQNLIPAPTANGTKGQLVGDSTT